MLNIRDMEWITTDPSCGQQMKKIAENIFAFKETRIFNPVTKETYLHKAIIDLSDYTQEEMFSCVEAFGYSFNEMCTWIDEGRNLDLIAECIFEMDT